MRATSGLRAGTRQIGLPVKGSSMTFAPEYARVVRSPTVCVWRNGTPMAPPKQTQRETIIGPFGEGPPAHPS